MVVGSCVLSCSWKCGSESVRGAQHMGKGLVEDTWAPWARSLHASVPQFTWATRLVVQVWEVELPGGAGPC